MCAAGPAQALGNFAQQPIANGMTVLIIDRFKAVEVEQRDRKRARFVRLRNLFLDAQIEFAPIGEAGERVGVGQLTHLSLQFEQVDHLAMLLDHHPQQEQRRDHQTGPRRDFGRIARRQHQQRDRRQPDPQIEEGRKADRRQAISGRERAHCHDHRVIAVRRGGRGEPVGHRPNAAHEPGDARHPARFADHPPRAARAHPATAIVHEECKAKDADNRQGHWKADTNDRVNRRHPGVDCGGRRRRQHQEQHRGQRFDAIGAQNRDIVPNIVRNRRKNSA